MNTLRSGFFSPFLAEHFIKEAFARHGQQVRFTPEAIEAMRLLRLKGNVRKLRALIERTVLIARRGDHHT